MRSLSSNGDLSDSGRSSLRRDNGTGRTMRNSSGSGTMRKRGLNLVDKGWYRV